MHNLNPSTHKYACLKDISVWFQRVFSSGELFQLKTFTADYHFFLLCVKKYIYFAVSFSQDPELISIVVAPTYRGLSQLTMKELENEQVYKIARNCLKKIQPLSITSRRNQSQPR